MNVGSGQVSCEELEAITVFLVINVADITVNRSFVMCVIIYSLLCINSVD